LICREAESKSHLSAWISACSASVFTSVVMNLSMWNLVLMKFGSLAKESTMREIDWGRLQFEAE
jgi:hypothetical protein